MSNQSTEVETIFVRRFVEDGELPKEDGLYRTDWRDMDFCLETKTWEDSEGYQRNVRWWLEEISFADYKNSLGYRELLEWIDEKAGKSFNKPFDADIKGDKPKWEISEAEILLLTELKKKILSLSPKEEVNFQELHEAFVTAMKIDDSKSVYEHLQMAFEWFKLQSIKRNK